jgi:Xaa-Pro aminopeptidase
MFQSFDTISDPSLAGPRVARLRAWLAERGLDGFLVPRADEHQGEYVPARAERLQWITGFTGSAGVALILSSSSTAATRCRPHSRPIRRSSRSKA